MTIHKHYELARRAHYGTSFSPEKRAESYCKDFDASIEALKAANVPDQYIQKWERYWVVWMERKSRCMSSMITGPARFPVARAEKANNAEHRAMQDCLNYYNKIMKRAKDEAYYAENPDARPVMAGDLDAIERLKDKLESLTKNQERMKEINKAHKAFLKNPETLEKSTLPECDKELIRRYVPAYSWEPHPFAPFELTNNLANIKRVQGRIDEISKRKETQGKEINVNGVRIVENTQDMRLQVFFNGKPARDMIELMKTNGFKWAPSVMAWQRQLTNNAVFTFNHYVLPKLKEAQNV